MHLEALSLFFVVLSLVQFSSGGTGGPPETSHCTPAECHLDERGPVCGSDGKTYESQCLLERSRCESGNAGQGEGGLGVDLKYKGRCQHTSCSSSREVALENQRKASGSVFVPECSPTESRLWEPVQCHKSTGYCWCVSPSDGKPVPSSSVRYQKPNCETLTKRRSNRRSARKETGGRRSCSSSERISFTYNMIAIFKSEYSRINPNQRKDETEKRVINWKFNQLDKNRDNVLRKKEVRDLKRMVKKIVKPRICAKVFTKYCDFNKDEVISRLEWSVCLRINAQEEDLLEGDDFTVDQDQDEEEDQDYDDKKRTSPMDILSWMHSSGSSPSSSLGMSLQPSLSLNEDKEDGEEEEEEEGALAQNQSQNCNFSRKAAQENFRQNPEAKIFVPECDPNGIVYKEIQCHEGYCWCVDLKLGVPVRGTATFNNIKPDCTQVKRPFKGCSVKKKQRFLNQLILSFEKDMLEENSTLTVPVSSKEMSARWKFDKLDLNKNKVLDRREWREFRKSWANNSTTTSVASAQATAGHRNAPTGQVPTTAKVMKKLRKCWRNFLRFCDFNNDKKIAQEEWFDCTGVAVKVKQNALPLNHKRRGPNPFSTILKAD